MNKLISLNSIKDIDYNKLGFKCGIEAHQQLNCSKLFCSCPCEIVSNNTLDKKVTRRLRFSQSETGQIDQVALDEFKKGKVNTYLYNDKIACQIDLDEQPPKGPNEKALSVALRISQMVNLKIFDKVQFMRKLIVDGSNTSGFQRTAMIGFGGHFKTKTGSVGINGINLEEDSCKIIEKSDNENIYCLDRLGIPLIEITTAPDIKNATEAYEVAYQIGNLLRSFPETKRGIGTIRQDLNISIKGGARVEIKGAQNLKLIPSIVDAEIKRQIIHISIIEELKNRGINTNNFSDKKIYDITNIFKNTTSKVILDNLEEKNAKVLAIKLNKFKGILGHEMQGNYRFATEISDRNKKHFKQIKGLFHLDEMPNYGITQKEVDEVCRELNMKDQDSFILLATAKNIAEESLKNILDIIELLITTVPSEVRDVDPKDTKTTFSRQMPGAARMYPETDIKDIIVDEEYLKELKKLIPELYDKKIERLKSQFDLDEIKTIDILNNYEENNFNDLLKIGVPPATTYSIIFDIPKEIKKRENIEPTELSIGLLKQILKLFSKGQLNKNTLYDLLLNIYKDNLSNIDNIETYIKDKGLGIKEINQNDLEKQIKEIINSNKGAPFGALMGLCMKHFQGKVEGKIISDTIKKLI